MNDRLPSICPLWLALAAAMWLASCSPSSIDGQEVGSRICQGGASDVVGGLPCGQFADFTRNQLDREQPAHSAIRDVEIYADPVFRQVSGYGARVLVVLRLYDEMAQSYWVSCGRGMDKDWCGSDGG